MANPKLFGRVWSVTIGPPGQAGRKWDDLRVTFRIEKSGASVPNKAEIAIYNLNADSRAFTEKKGNAILLAAGYQDPGEKLLFSGAVRLAGHRKEGPDWVGSFECGDGVRAYTSTVLHESFKAGTTEKAAIEAVAKAMGVTIGKLDGLSEEQYGTGRQLSGAARYYLDTLCQTRRLRWSIQDGILQILPYGKDIGEEAVLLSPDTGLIGSPEKTESGYKFRSLLQGGINPGRAIKADSREVKGFYVAEKVVHLGDSEGQDWYTTIEALPLR